jgi:hypothetical protein
LQFNSYEIRILETVIVPLTLKGERTPRVFENRALTRIVRIKMEELETEEIAYMDFSQSVLLAKSTQVK